MRGAGRKRISRSRKRSSIDRWFDYNLRAEGKSFTQRRKDAKENLSSPLRETLFSSYRGSHLTHRVLQSHKNRARNDVVTDVEFGDQLDLCNCADVSISQPVSGGDT